MSDYFSLDQHNLGMSMKVERSSLDQVKDRFEAVKKKKAEEKKQYGEIKNSYMYMDKWIDGCMDRLMNVWMNECMDG